MSIQSEETILHLRQATREIFGSLVSSLSMITSREQAESPPFVERLGEIEAVVAFLGETCGEVVLRTSAADAAGIARVLLELPRNELLEPEEIEDALGECANLVTGGLKTRVLDPRGAFQLAPPEVRSHSISDRAERSGLMVLSHREGPVAIEIWLEEEAL